MKALKDVVRKAKSVITEPDRFFASVKKEKGLAEPAKFYAVVSGVPLLVLAALTVAGFSIMPMMGLVMGGTMVTGLAFVWLLQIVGLFFSAGITHIAVKLLGGKNSYADTYKAIAYGSTPAALLGIIPYVGIVASVYSLYIDIKGVSALQKMSAARSAIAVLILPLLVLLLAVFVASKLTGTGMFY